MSPCIWEEPQQAAQGKELHTYTPVYRIGLSASYMVGAQNSSVAGFDFSGKLSQFSFRLKPSKSGVILHLFSLFPNLNTLTHRTAFNK